MSWSVFINFVTSPQLNGVTLKLLYIGVIIACCDCATVGVSSGEVQLLWQQLSRVCGTLFKQHAIWGQQRVECSDSGGSGVFQGACFSLSSLFQFHAYLVINLPSLVLFAGDSSALTSTL
jgi:hypothetical protein